MFTYTFNGRKNSYGEYVVRCYRDGKLHENGHYFTDDKADALSTMIELIKRQLAPRES